MFVSPRHTVGDTKVPFCLQSCVKPLKYAIAVHDHGTEYVHRFIGKEPSGLRFNKLFLNEDGKKKAPVASVLHSQEDQDVTHSALQGQLLAWLPWQGVKLLMGGLKSRVEHMKEGLNIPPSLFLSTFECPRAAG